MSKLETLRAELEKARDSLHKKGKEFNGNDDFMKAKPFEIAYQDVIEKIWPDSCWWEVTHYWDIFDAMMGGLSDSEVIDEIIKHVDKDYLNESACDKVNGACVEFNHNIKDYLDKFGDDYNDGKLWDFSKEDFENGAVENRDDIVYWYMKDLDGDWRYFETNDAPKHEDAPMKESKLEEGTSNFGRGPEHFPLLVFYTYDEVFGMMDADGDRPHEWSFENDDGDVDEEAYEAAVEKWEEEFWDNLEVTALDEDSVERLKDKLYDFNEESKRMAWDADYNEENHEQEYGPNLNLDDVKVKVEPGYYEAAYIDVEHEDYLDYLEDDFREQQIERFTKLFQELKEEFGLTQLSAGPAASNGERFYSIVKDESLEESCSDKELVDKLVAFGTCDSEEEAEKRVARMSQEMKDEMCKSLNRQAQDHLLNDSLKESNEVARVEYCVMDKDNNNIECFDNTDDAIAFAKDNEGIRVLEVQYGPKDEHGDEPELSAEEVWSIRESLKEDKKPLNRDAKEVKSLYNKYVKEWKEDHKGSEYKGMEPASFDEWYDNEYLDSFDESLEEKKSKKKYKINFTGDPAKNAAFFNHAMGSDKGVESSEVSLGEEKILDLDDMDDSLKEASHRGYAYYEYKGCHVRETPSCFVAVDEHGTTLGDSKTRAGAEALIDDHTKKEEKLSNKDIDKQVKRNMKYLKWKDEYEKKNSKEEKKEEAIEEDDTMKDEEVIYIKYWETEELRDYGFSEIYLEKFNSIEDAKEVARKIIDRDGYASVEVMVSPDGDIEGENDYVVWGYDGEDTWGQNGIYKKDESLEESNDDVYALHVKVVDSNSGRTLKVDRIFVGSRKECMAQKKHLEEVSPEDSNHNRNIYKVSKVK